jgi:hypothetical protein
MAIRITHSALLLTTLIAFGCVENKSSSGDGDAGAAGEGGSTAGSGSGRGGSKSDGGAGQTGDGDSSDAGAATDSPGTGGKTGSGNGPSGPGGASDGGASDGGASDGDASEGGSGATTGGGGPTTGGGETDDGARRFFLPTGEPDNTSAPTIEIDAKGAMHAVYPAYAGGGAYYAYCTADCAGTDAVKVVRFETDGTVANAMLALTSDGHPRVLLSSFQKVYYASCDANCTSPSGWQQTEIMDHQGDREVSGEALALDSQDRPRFLMHTYRAYLGIGQKDPKTWYLRCDGSCDDPDSWKSSEIATEIWEGSHLRFDANDRAHLATVVRVNDGDRAGQKLSAYFECDGECSTNDDWKGIGFVEAYESETEAVSIVPTVAMALTSEGAPRVVVLGKGDDGKKNIIFFECDDDCTKDNWQGTVVSNHDRISAGLDLALDANGRPRLAYTLDYNIGLAYCDDAHCGGPEANWDLTKVELGSDIPPDDIFLWENCTVAAWFLHSPSVALTRDGKPRIGYQARDISGGYDLPDPTAPGCVAGTDMTWSRVAFLPSYK